MQLRRLAYEYVQQVVEKTKELSIDMQHAVRIEAEQSSGTEFGAAIKFLEENKVYDAQKVYDEVSERVSVANLHWPFVSAVQTCLMISVNGLGW